MFQASARFADAVESEALAAEAMAATGRPDEARTQLARLLPTLARHHRPLAEVRARLQLSRLHLGARPSGPSRSPATAAPSRRSMRLGSSGPAPKPA